MLVVARGQPAWLGANVGPGLMAQLLSVGVIMLGALWAAWRVFEPPPPPPGGGASCDTPTGASPQHWSGPAILGAVLVFALALPAAGLVVAAGLAAALAAWGAGERGPLALAATVAGLAAMTVGIGLALLPPTSPLWPRL